jgi:GLPGLI family protein
MKHIILYICLGLYSLPILTQNRVTKVTYKLNMNLETLPDNISKKYNATQKEQLKRKYENYNALEYTLLYNSKESLFYFTDSIVGLSKEYDNSNIEKQKILKNERKKKYYKSITENQTLFATALSGELLLIKSPLHFLEWKLTNENKEIGGYNCYKATLSKEGNYLLGYNEDMTITAWYCPEFPVPFGPMEFGSLPGLILELQLGRKTYYVDAIKFNQNETIKPLTKGKPMALEKYSDFLHSFFDADFGK